MNDFTDYDSSLFSVFFIWTRVILMQLPFIYFFYLSIKSNKDILYYIKIIILSGIIVNSVGVVMYFVGFQVTELNRIGLSFDDANYLGRFEVIVISISLIYILFVKISFLKKLFLCSLIFVSFNFLILSVSRAALLSLAIVTVFILLFYPNKIIKFSSIGATIVVFLFLIVIVGSQKANPMGAGDVSSSFIDLSNATRVALMYASFFAFLDYPIFGIGIYNFFNAYLNHGYMPVDLPLGVKVTVVHSWLFSTLAEQGLFGIIPLLALLYKLTRDLFKFTLKSTGEKKYIGLIILSLLFILLFNGFVNPVFYAEVQFSVIAGLAGGYLKVSTLTNQKIINGYSN
ncbi:MAG: O-antigen ligase family protein [Ignavibacteriae bacterium]|nr:O-antigen ligase family protein [Ignavibacteriota bacterium]